MKKNQILAMLLAGSLTITNTALGVIGAEFTDGSAVERAETTEITEVSEDPIPTEASESADTAPEFTDTEEMPAQAEASQDDPFQSENEIKKLVSIDKVNYRYEEKTDSYCVVGVYGGSGQTMTVVPEISGKKVTSVYVGIYNEAYNNAWENEDFEYITGDIILPDTIEKIEQSAFSSGGCISMILPDSVKEIGSKAFGNCQNMRCLRFSAGCATFPAGLFEKCGHLENIEIPEGVTTIESGAMKGCPALKKLTIPSTVTAIGGDLFETDTRPTIYGINGSFAETYAKSNNLTFVSQSDPEPETKDVVKDGVQYTYQKDSDTYTVTGFTPQIIPELTIEAGIGGKAVTAIGASAFEKCFPLKKVTIPETVRTIGDRAFCMCSALEEAAISHGLKTVGSRAFSSCTELKEAVFPDSVTAIGEGALSYCYRLEKVQFPKNLKRIEKGLLEWSTVKSPVVIPGKVTVIADGAFNTANCGEIVIPSSVKEIGTGAFRESRITKVEIPDSVTKIGNAAFEDCSFLRSVTWGKGMKTIPANTFFGCCMEEFYVSDTVTSIGEMAFNSQTLRRVYIPSTVKSIHKNAFRNDKTLTLFVDKGSYGETFAKKYKFNYDTGSMELAYVKLEGITYRYDSAKKTYKAVSADKELAGAVVIPAKVNGKKVTEIEKEAFHSHDKITSVTLPDTIVSVGDEAFWGCHMESVKIPSSVTSIGEYAFAQNDFTKITIPDSVKTLGKGAFGGCEKMKEIRFPKSMKKVPEAVCGGNAALEKVTLSDSVTEIGKSAFVSCGFTSFPWPSKLEIIGERAFAESAKLNFTHIPSTVKTIRTEAFGSCNSLKDVTIPGTVKTINSYLFWQCKGLEKVTFEHGVEKVDYRTVDFCDNLKEVHIPETVYSIEDMELGAGCSVYGLTGTEAERFARSYGYPFVSQGKAVIGVPDLKVTAYSCNNLKMEIKSRCLNADFYEYVLSKDKNFPKTGKYVYYQERSQYLSTDFYRLDKGTYYIFARAGRYDIDSTRKYSAWTKPVKMIIAAQAPGIPKIKSITVKGTTVTVTLNKLSGADGYAAVLAVGADKVGFQKLYQPNKIQYSSGNRATTQFVFKNVKPGSYRLMTRGYKQATGGKFYGKWGRYSKKIQIK